MHWRNQRRAELQAPCRVRRTGASSRLAADRGADERPQGRAPPAAKASAPLRSHSTCSARGTFGYSARELLADRGYDSDRFRDALGKRGIAPCIPPTRNRKVPLGYDKILYKQRHRIENSFGRLKDWRRIAMRYDRCAHTFMSAICLAATVIFWLP